jgi:catechol 2,3-dioxygenase-like lactoylglutathione lyase family enzyme
MSPITQLATVVVPVADQDRALAFYADVLGMQPRLDFTYATGERWLEVVPPGALTSLCLVVATADAPAGVETGVILSSSDVPGDLARLRAAGALVDDEPLPEGEVVLFAGAPLAGLPPQFRIRDPDGNVLLVVAAPS